MELLDKLARTDIDPALLAQVRSVLVEKDFKITALTHELNWPTIAGFVSAKPVKRSLANSACCSKKRSIWIWRPSRRARKRSTRQAAAQARRAPAATSALGTH